MSFKNTFGWGLIVIGVGIIFWTLYSSYNIFVGKTPPPEVFKIEKPKTQAPAPPKKKLPATQEELQKQLSEIFAQQLMEILPPETLPRLLNLISWSIFAGILIFGASQIANLGIKILKK